jgi:aminopeptidase N
MSSHFLTDKSMVLESRFGGWALGAGRPFAEPGVEPNYAPDRTCRIVHIAVEMRIDPDTRTYASTTRLRLEPVGGGPERWALDLEGLTVTSVQDASGNAIAYRHADGRLEFPATRELVVVAHGVPRRGLYFVGPTPAEPTRRPEAWTQCQDEDAHRLFPCHDHPSVKHPFSIRVVAPDGYTVVSNGRLAGRDGNAWAWEQAEPMPAYLVSVVVARLDRHSDDEAGVPIAYFVPTGTPDDTVRRVFGRTPAMVRFLSERFCAYPWPRYDQVVVHDFIFGGMENVAATTLTDLVLTDARAGLDWDADDLIVHELAHQWFGDLVTCQDWSQAWLNEGWATYTEVLWAAHHDGADAAAWHLWEQLGSYLGEDGDRYRRPIVSYHFKAPIDLFDRHLYEKGGLVLHTLRAVLGEGAFWAGVRLYLARHAHGTVHTRHFQRAMEEASGRSLDRFFAQWVMGAGHPELEVELAHDAGMLSVTVRQTQEGEGTAAAFAFPLDIDVDGVAHRLAVDRRERTFSLPCADVPTLVRVDGDFRVLADLRLRAPRSWLIASLRGDPGVVARIRAARALAKEGHADGLAALRDAVRTDVHWGVRGEIADLLAARGAEEDVAALAAASADPHPKARRRIVAALGATRRESAAAAIVAMPEDVSLQVTGEIARALGRLRVPQARARCEALLGETSWGEVLRARALEGLGHLRDADVLPHLLRATEDSSPARARAAACGAMARLADEVDSVRTTVAERLMLLAEDENYRVQVAALGALSTLRDPRAMRTLGRVHDSAGDGRARRLAFEAMASIRAGRTSQEGLGVLRREVEGLVEENRKLRARVERVETRGAGA